jgi:hypothetical protein
VASAALLVATVNSSTPAGAQTTDDKDKALATALFQEGRTLMADGRIPEACLKFEESQRLDPGGGTILNLALCHERDGRLALAWSEFNEALAFARRDRRADREAAAQEYARQLEPRLSRLTVVVPPESRLVGLRVERDGRELSEASWSVAVPIDGVEHAVRATAPGHAPFAISVSLSGEGKQTTVEIPRLAPASPPTGAAVGAQAVPTVISASPLDTHDPVGHKAHRTAGWVVGAASLAQLGAAGYFGVRAFQLHPGDDASAGRAADRSTLLAVTGLVTLAASVYLLW